MTGPVQFTERAKTAVVRPRRRTYHAAMSIYLDDEPIQLDGQDLAALLAAANDHAALSGRMVVQVLVDGQPITADDLQQAADVGVLDREIRLYTAQPAELAGEALEQARDHLGQARELQAQAAELLQQDDASDALRKVADLIDIWLQTQQAVLQTTTLMRIDLDQLTVQDEPVPALIEQMIDRLKEMKQAITDRDTVALADTLEYEWPQLAQRWDDLITVLIQRVRA